MIRRALLLAGLLAAGCASPRRGAPRWSDEFDSKVRGAAPDPAKWKLESGNNGGWGNQELEDYRPSNAFQDGEGHLVIEAVRTSSGTWTSARMNTSGRAYFRFGRVEARMKLPAGAGLWPAFWMMGKDLDKAGWPAVGEIDVMENVPRVGADHRPLGPGIVAATVHGPGYSGASGPGRDFVFPAGVSVDSDFHVYGVLWSRDRLAFYVDDPARPFFVFTPADVPAGAAWPFNGPFFLLMNLAVGGSWPGPPDAATPSPARMLVDYVRVYGPT